MIIVLRACKKALDTFYKKVYTYLEVQNYVEIKRDTRLSITIYSIK